MPLIIVLVPIFIGQYYGIYRSKKKPEELQRESVGTAVGAAFALLAFMLAFTFQIATDRYNTRKELLLTEVTNIRTAYLRAGLLPEPFRSDSKKLLADILFHACTWLSVRHFGERKFYDKPSAGNCFCCSYVYKITHK